MARKQLEIAGTRTETDVPAAVVEAGEKYIEMRREQRRARDKTADALAGTLHLMAAHKLEEYVVKDPDTGEKLKLRARTVTKLSVVKVRPDDDEGEEFEIGEGVEGFSDAPAGVHPNLIAQAEADNAAAGLEVNDEGDVGVPDKAAPKAKRGRKPKKPAATKDEGAEADEIAATNGDQMADDEDPVVTTAGGGKRRVPKRNATEGQE